MKIAVVWDFLIDKGGAERELIIIARALDADIITTHFLKNKTYAEFSKMRVVPHPLKSYPTPLLMQKEASKIFKKIDLSKYDLVISMGDWAKFVSMNKTLRARHIHITISPPRMFYMKSSVKNQLGMAKRVVFSTWAHFAAKRDVEAMRRIDEVIVQSLEAKRRVETYYNKKPHRIVLYPPTEIQKFKSGKSKGYFMSVQRLMPQKNIEIQIEAFNALPKEKLIVVGSMLDNKIDYFKKLRASANKNIKFVTNVNDKELVKLYSHAKCVIQTSENEDFGLVPVEAMASGKPCIAVNEGGFRETITNKTGILIEKPYVESLINAVNNFDENKFSTRELKERSKLFSEKIFIRNLMKVISGV
ncbi:MAG TPA: glycosyltransferase [archaeon]|nr:glycosyltransferase [archaeon]